MSNEFYINVKNLWSNVSKNSTIRIDEIENKINSYKKLLNVFHIGEYYYFVFNVYKAEFETISEEITQILGYNKNEISIKFFLNKIHPEDISYFLNFEKTVTDFFTNIPAEKISKYKVQYDFRIKNVKEKYIRILHQLVVIQNHNNDLLYSFGLHTDISHIKNEGSPSLSIIGLDQEPSYYNIKTLNLLNPSNSLFTKREKEILKKMVEGKSSQQIAHELYLSLHTVKTHRKNILNKTELKTSTELIVTAIKEGWV